MYRDSLRIAADIFADQISQIVSEISINEVGDEDDISSQIIGRFKCAIAHIPGPIIWSAHSVANHDGIRFTGRRLTSRGRGSEESRSGADIALFIDINIPGYKLAKGLLIQAKMVDSNGRIQSKVEQVRLIDQCKKMLSITSSSFVWTYGDRGIDVYSANAVLASNGLLNNIVGTWDNSIFFYDFFICWIGDCSMESITRDSLDEYISSMNIKYGVMLHAHIDDRGDDL